LRTAALADANGARLYQGVALGRGTLWFDWICARGTELGCREEKFLVRTIDARRK
jgi:hypothetical protein